MSYSAFDQTNNDTKPNIDYLTLGIRTWATSMEVFLHRDFGSRYLGINAALVFPLVLVFRAFWPIHDLEPLLWFLVFYFCMLLIARASIIDRYMKGDSGHSYYNGWPVLLNKSKCDELRAKRINEPIVVFIVGFLLTFEYEFEPLGWFVMFGASALFLSSLMTHMSNRMRAMDIRDAFIDQGMVAESVRSRNF